MDHLAILDKKRKLLQKIISGEKTIESRWYKTKRTPWNNIKQGDMIYFKDCGELITAKAKVETTLFFDDLNKEKVEEFRKKAEEENIGKAWASAVGKKAHAHTKPVAVRRAALIVNVDNSSWLYELTLKKRETLKKMQEKIKGKERSWWLPCM